LGLKLQDSKTIHLTTRCQPATGTKVQTWPILETTADLKKNTSRLLSLFSFKILSTSIDQCFVRKYGNLCVFLKTLSQKVPKRCNKTKSEHLQNAANFSNFILLPFASVMVDLPGISVVNGDQRKTAEWWQLKDIRRELLRSNTKP
jgi:hypothetical protein